MVLGNRNVCPDLENGFHDLGIARDLLLVSAGERFDLQQSQQLFDFPVCQSASLDAGGRANALNRRDAAERVQSLGRKRSERAPSPLELIDFAEKSQHAGGYLDRLCIHRSSSPPKESPDYTHLSTQKSTRLHSNRGRNDIFKMEGVTQVCSVRSLISLKPGHRMIQAVLNLRFYSKKHDLNRGMTHLSPHPMCQ